MVHLRSAATVATALALAFAGLSPVHAQSTGTDGAAARAVSPRSACPPQHPSYDLLRQKEHWGYLSDPACRTDYADPLKHIAVGTASFAYLGGESRSLAEAVENQGSDPSRDDAYLLQRLTLHAGLQLLNRSGRSRESGFSGRLFAEFKSGLVPGLDQVGPADRDRLDLGQAFADVAYAWGGAQSDGPSRLTLRAGRFELRYGFEGRPVYGTGRMLAVREGPNVRASFDGALARLTLGESGLFESGFLAGWTADAFATWPNTTRPGVFDNERTDGAALWGVYSGGPLTSGDQALGSHALDVYYLGFEREGTGYAQGAFDQMRNSFGARWIFRSAGPGDSVSCGRWTHDLEAILQSGTARAGRAAGGNAAGNRPPGNQSPGDILAWRLASEMSYAFGGRPGSPALGLGVDVASGDSDPSDSDLQTFTAPFPPGRFFDRAVPFGPSNLTNVRPTLSLKPLPWLSLTAGAHFFWRTSKSDGVYAVPGFAVREATAAEDGVDARFIGWEPGVILTATATRHLTTSVEANQFRPGTYYAQSGSSEVVSYLGLEVTYKF